MKKTDGLVELLAVEVGKFSIPSNKEITKLANSVRTYISERLKEVENKKLCGKGYSSCMSCPYYAECDDRQIHNSCLKSVREALGVDKMKDTDVMTQLYEEKMQKIASLESDLARMKGFMEKIRDEHNSDLWQELHAIKNIAKQALRLGE